jgi:hypothetical protein
MRLIPALITVALALSLAACAGDHPASRPIEITVVTISADPDGPGPHRMRSARLRCPKRDTRRECRQLRALPRTAFEPVPAGVSCAQIFDGPQTARILGVVRGRRVAAEYNRTDSCQIERYDRVAPLLVLALGTRSP